MTTVAAACAVDDAESACLCDHVQLLTDGGERIELHHVVPDDGAQHTVDLQCPCQPDFERLQHGLIVVGHRDQDL